MLFTPTYAHPLQKWWLAPAIVVAMLVAMLIPDRRAHLAGGLSGTTDGRSVRGR